MGRLQGKVALITGAARGLGLAIGRRFREEGASVILNDLDPVTVEKAASELGGSGIAADVSDSRAVARMFEQVASDHGRLDVLVNNAGIIHRGSAEETDNDQWAETIAINLSAVFFLSRAALPVLRARGGGVIVNIASDWGLVGAKGALAYCASKGAVVQMTRAMALDHAHENIRINAICPGDTDTPMLDAGARQRGQVPAEARREMAAAVPLGRIGSPEEIAKLTAYLVSDGAAYMTGAALAIDGGHTAG